VALRFTDAEDADEAAVTKVCQCAPDRIRRAMDMGHDLLETERLMKMQKPQDRPLHQGNLTCGIRRDHTAPLLTLGQISAA